MPSRGNACCAANAVAGGGLWQRTAAFRLAQTLSGRCQSPHFEAGESIVVWCGDGSIEQRQSFSRMFVW